jgi:hypothetical protein
MCPTSTVTFQDRGGGRGSLPLPFSPEKAGTPPGAAWCCGGWHVRPMLACAGLPTLNATQSWLSRLRAGHQCVTVDLRPRLLRQVLLLRKVAQ